MPNPYEAKGNAQFWRSAVAGLAPVEVRPIPAKRFDIPRGTRVGTAGSCFAQEVAKVLVGLPDVEFLQTEANAPDQPVFSALYGNIYTVRQLRQILFEAFELTPPLHVAWKRPDGRWVDACRPTTFAAGFGSPVAVAEERIRHLAAVRRMFSECSVFVFTLGLTEAWVSPSGGSVFPVAPGVVAEDPSGADYKFHNFSYSEVLQDLSDFVSSFAIVNSKARVILTVSPVPLIGTYTDDHVLIANTHSKSICRAVCSAAESLWNNVFYFPSYEIITGHFNSGVYYDPNKRTIARAGVDHVMSVFKETYLGSKPDVPARDDGPSLLDEAYEAGGKIICDEDLIVKSVGF